MYVPINVMLHTVFLHISRVVSEMQMYNYYLTLYFKPILIILSNKLLQAL